MSQPPYEPSGYGPAPGYGAPPYGPPPGYGPPQPAPQYGPEQYGAQLHGPQQHGAQQYGPQQYGPQQPYGPPALPGPGLGTHLKRAIDWNVAEIVVTPREQQALTAAGVEPRLQPLFVWRRSSLLVVLPFLVLSVILSFVQAGDTDTTGFTGVGDLVNWLPSVALVFVPIGALRAVSGWTELRSSSRFLIACWLISIVVPMLVALVPIDYIVDLDALRAQAGGESLDAQILAGRVALAVGYALALLPVVVSVPGGVLKGAARVKSLFPSASLPGWFLVSVAPFYSMFTVVVFVLIDQIVGNGILLLGVGLLAFTPWLFVVYRRVYARPLSIAEARTELARASRFGGYLIILAIVLIATFLFTAKVGSRDVIGSDSDTAVFTHLEILRTLAEVLSRSVVTTVVFCTVFLQMIFADWQVQRGMREDIRREHDLEMAALQRYVARSREDG